MASRRDISLSPRRLLVVAGMACLWAVAIVAKLLYLQVVCHSQLLGQADRQQHRRVTVRAPRGVIWDRTGQPLAMSLTANTVSVNPLRIPNRALAADLLSRVLGLDRDDTFEKIETAFAKRRGFLALKKQVSQQEAERIKELKLEWVEFRTQGQRFYPNDMLAASVVGSVDHLEGGNVGLERSLNKDLQGRPGVMRTFADAQGRPIESDVAVAPRAGVNLTLTIDNRLQFVAERELEAAAKQWNARAGSVVVMDPYTGDILAMASWPTFDPNERPDPGEQLSNRLNQAAQMAFEPGSVFKVVTLAAAIDSGRATPETRIDAGNGRFIGRVLHEAHAGRTYGVLSVADVLAKSSNIGAARVGLLLGEDKLKEYVLRFGFGSATGLPLPSESTGKVRKKWQVTSLPSVAMGHEIQTSPVQLARACSVIANGGMLVQPRLILSRQEPGEKPQAVPVNPPVRIIKPESAIKMRQMMEGVVVLPYGTGHAARIPGYSVGGKTGSAQIYDFEARHYTSYYNGSFMGFAPVTNPRVVITVTLNGTRKFGGVVAAPVFSAVGKEVLRILDVPKDLPETETQPDTQPVEEEDIAIAAVEPQPEQPQPAPVPALLARASIPGVVRETAITFGPTVPSFYGKSMRTVLEESASKGLKVEVYGNGIARLQAPPAGAALNPGEPIKVQFAR